MTYRISALGAAARGMWRGWTVLVPVVVVNAALQALLVWPSVTIDASAMLVALALASYVVLLVAAGLVVAVALAVPDGRVRWGQVIARLRVRAVPWACWTTAFAVVVAAAWAFSVVPGALVLAVGVYVPFAALDGRGPTLRVAWAALRRRFWRWLLTSVVVGVLGFVGLVVAGFTMFFLRGSFGSAVVWLVGGMVAAWVAVAWGLLYRAAVDDARAVVPSSVDA
jgi:hypothetical protein